MGDVVLFVNDLNSYSAVYVCRICHEEEFENAGSLESPCSCSGTVKFAHRECIQRWCDEKGNTVCEICLQKFEPDYTAAPKKTPLLDTTLTIRESVEMPRREGDLEDQQVEVAAERHIRETEYSQCSSAADRRVAFLFTIILLARHLLALLAGTTDGHPFTLLTLVVIKTSGILLPMFILIRMITAVQDSIRHHHQYQESDDDILYSDEDSSED